nr:involucrin [Microcebus murinus]
MSQQHTLPVTLPPALSQELLKTGCPPADIQQEQRKQPTPLPAPCHKGHSEHPAEVPSKHEEKCTTPVQGPQEQELHLGKQQQQESQEQELQQQHQGQHEKHQEAENLEQQLEQEKAQREEQLKEQLEEKKRLLDQQLDEEVAKRYEQLGMKKEQLLEPLGQQEGQLEKPGFVLAPGQVQDIQPPQPPKGEVLLPAEQQQEPEV